MFPRLQFVLAALCASALPLGAQATPRDSSFRLGFCSHPPADSSVWSRLVETPDAPARIQRDPLPHPPLDFRDEDGNYLGRVVLSVMVDETGHVVPGSVDISQSTDSRLSRWACSIAEHIRFTAATVGGKAVLTMVDLPLTYSFGAPPPNFKKP